MLTVILITKLFQIVTQVCSQGTLVHPLPVSALSKSQNKTLGAGPGNQEDIILSVADSGGVTGHPWAGLPL